MQLDGWTLAFQTVNFLIVVWLLSRFLYRPIRRVIEAREAADRKAAEDADARAAAADRAREDYARRLAELEAAARARRAGEAAAQERERAAVLEAAKAEAGRMLDDARERMAREEKQALEALRGRIAGIAANLARAALAGFPQSEAGTVAAVAAHLDSLPAGELADLRTDLQGPDAALVVALARAPDDTAQAAWRAALGPRLGDGLRLVFREDPDLIAGAELRLPHAALRFSVADRLRRAADALES